MVLVLLESVSWLSLSLFLSNMSSFDLQGIVQQIKTDYLEFYDMLVVASVAFIKNRKPKRIVQKIAESKSRTVTYLVMLEEDRPCFVTQDSATKKTFPAPVYLLLIFLVFCYCYFIAAWL